MQVHILHIGLTKYPVGALIMMATIMYSVSIESLLNKLYHSYQITMKNDVTMTS